MRRALNSIAANLTRIRTRKAMARRAIAGGLLPLRAGRWRLGSSFSVHSALASLPPPLDAAKQWGGWRSGGLLKQAMALAEKAVPPWTVRVAAPPTPAAPALACDVVLINRLGEPVGFDTDESQVVRLIGDAELDAITISAERLGAAYACVAPRRVPGTGYTTEPLIAGRNFAQAGPDERLAMVHQFWAGLVRQPAASLSPECLAAWTRSAREVIASRGHDQDMQSQLQTGMDELIARAKVCFTHGDLFADNIIVAADGPILIDIDKAGLAPAFTDVVTLLLFESRTLRDDLARAYFAGRFDEHLKRLGCTLSTVDSGLERLVQIYGWLSWKLTTETLSPLNIARLLEVLDDHTDARR